ncbi:MAG: hypothetical protein ABSG43_10040 [Solirubrobacteraceae bacterium]|jgi:hypothetical protein
MPASPIDVVNEWLQNLVDPELVNSVVAPDASYVSLNTEDAELSKIMPWAGASHGPQALLDNLGAMFTRWENQAFNVTTMFASDLSPNLEVVAHARHNRIVRHEAPRIERR